MLLAKTGAKICCFYQQHIANVLSPVSPYYSLTFCAFFHRSKSMKVVNSFPPLSQFFSNGLYNTNNSSISSWRTVLFFWNQSQNTKFRHTPWTFVLTVQTKTIERDWHWTSISAIFGFTFWTRVLTPDVYAAQWIDPIVCMHSVVYSYLTNINLDNAREAAVCSCRSGYLTGLLHTVTIREPSRDNRLLPPRVESAWI